ncbi:MAG: hypothetical protein JW781_06445 [Deltaproteobacteria bacterium]|nr:hypothetical protein [Candidatus Anaeroferrophillacea bacterium]
MLSGLITVAVIRPGAAGAVEEPAAVSASVGAPPGSGAMGDVPPPSVVKAPDRGDAGAASVPAVAATEVGDEVSVPAAAADTGAEAAAPAGNGNAEPAMVSRHMFSPEQDEPEAAVPTDGRTPESIKIEAELIFTGVIRTPKDKWAIIRPKKQVRRQDGQWRFREGEEVDSYQVHEIGPNYVILMDKDKPVRLNLYGGAKQRPAPAPLPQPVAAASAPAETAAAAASAGAAPPGSVTTADGQPVSGGSVVGGPKTPAADAADAKKEPPAAEPAKKPAVPFAEIIRRARESGGTSGGPAANPFMRIIQQNQQNQGK